MNRRTPTSKRPDNPFPYTTPFRSQNLPGIDRQGCPARSALCRETAFLGQAAPQVPGGLVDGHALAKLLARHVEPPGIDDGDRAAIGVARHGNDGDGRSEEHTSELQSLMRSSYAVFCLKKNNILIT